MRRGHVFEDRLVVVERGEDGLIVGVKCVRFEDVLHASSSGSSLFVAIRGREEDRVFTLGGEGMPTVHEALEAIARYCANLLAPTLTRPVFDPAVVHEPFDPTKHQKGIPGRGEVPKASVWTTAPDRTRSTSAPIGFADWVEPHLQHGPAASEVCTELLDCPGPTHFSECPGADWNKTLPYGPGQ